jgi:cytochrome c oxidase assembly protein subunit 15
MTSFARFAWSVLAYNVAVIAWGGLVRATGSGAGCGMHWPTCNGQVVPRSAGVETAIEFTHRATSGLALALVVVLLAWAWRALPRGHAARTGAVLSTVFIVMEALLGAALVLFGWVAKDTSVGRGWAMPLHLVNTFLLLASLALTAAWARQERVVPFAMPRRTLLVAFGAAAGALLLAGATGAVAALGDTLFPATTFGEGLRQDFQGSAHVLIRLRVLHPFAALLSAVLVVVTAWLATPDGRDRQVTRAAGALVGLVALQLVAGVVNLLLLAPVWLQLVHLVLADLVWIALVVTAAWTVAPREEPRRDAEPAPVRVAMPG